MQSVEQWAGSAACSDTARRQLYRRLPADPRQRQGSPFNDLLNTAFTFSSAKPWLALDGCAVRSTDDPPRSRSGCVTIKCCVFPIVTAGNTGLYLLTSCSTVLLEKLTGSQLVKIFLTFNGTRRFITAFTNARHLSLS